ncbi:MAG: ADP-forming succinate--CoA ligase subunit beta [Gammaproteobacteria bacterium]|nr:ADP-forming succinate--CoA ligase subunit beta [Gammaproteobacteria bacterium]MYD80034.1 ADP-forming succinate--CoA ligase subunit beta [Gammaproteobacteria bacterium]
MNLHEFQAKELFREYGLPVSKGVVATTVEEAVDAAEQLGGNRWACKVQVHAGGRGKAGGVKLVEGPDGLQEFASSWLGQRLVTHQTDQLGQPINHIYIEELADIDREFYLGLVIDRSSRRVVVMASTEGGVEIEKVAEENPERILKAEIDPFVGAQPYQGRELAFGLGLRDGQVRQFTEVFLGLCRLFHELDCSLVEVNPLVVTSDGSVHCLDAKINIDGNALFRQSRLADLRDPKQEDEREAQASEFGLSYVALDGNIGCMVNGAGLAMGTMDLVKYYGGNPANFLDVGGAVNKQSVAEAFKIILDDSDVKAVLINIFGGIVSCVVIAEGIVEAYKEVGVSVPVVVRFDGNSAAEGRAFLESSGLDIIASTTLQDATQKAVDAAGSVS